MTFPMVGFLANNQDSELIMKIKRNLEEYEISYSIYHNAKECLANTDYDKPPRIVLIDKETVDYDSNIQFLIERLNSLDIYCMVITNDYHEKDLVMKLYKIGASDVRPKDHAKQITSSITTIFPQNFCSCLIYLTFFSGGLD